MDWIHLAEVADQRQAVVNAVIEHTCGLKRDGKFLR